MIYKNSQRAGFGRQHEVCWPLGTGLKSALKGTNWGQALLGADINKRQRESGEEEKQFIFFHNMENVEKGILDQKKKKLCKGADEREGQHGKWQIAWCSWSTENMIGSD